MPDDLFKLVAIFVLGTPGLYLAYVLLLLLRHFGVGV